jgi:hypothetical protein
VNFKKILSFLKLLKSKGIDTGLSSLCYFSASEMEPGHHFFIKKFLNSRYDFKYLTFYLKQFFSIHNAYNFILSTDRNFSQKKMYITWGFKKDFDAKGNIRDQYFKISSYDKNILWLVLYADKKVPNKISENIILISNLQSKNKIRCFLSIFYLLKILFEKKFKVKKIFHELSFSSLLAENVYTKLKHMIDVKKIREIFMPYEGQPFQNFIPQQLKKINNKIKIYGYVSHNLPHSFDMIHRNGSPDILFLQSKDQVCHFSKNLGWNKNKLKLIDSLRHQKVNKRILSNRIFFPNYLSDIKNLSKNFNDYLSTRRDYSVPKLKINIHPRSYNSNLQNLLKKNFKEIMKKNKKKFAKHLNKNISLVIGLTSTPVYLLAHKIKVIHIVNNNFFHSYNEKYWPSLKVKKINDYIFEYMPKKNKKVINLLKKNKSNLLLRNLNNRS